MRQIVYIFSGIIKADKKQKEHFKFIHQLLEQTLVNTLCSFFVNQNLPILRWPVPSNCLAHLPCQLKCQFYGHGHCKPTKSIPTHWRFEDRSQVFRRLKLEKDLSQQTDVTGRVRSCAAVKWRKHKDISLCQQVVLFPGVLLHFALLLPFFRLSSSHFNSSKLVKSGNAWNSCNNIRC